MHVEYFGDASKVSVGPREAASSHLGGVDRSLPLNERSSRNPVFSITLSIFANHYRHHAAGLAKKYEINADMGEGFGRWKMASTVMQTTPQY